MGDYRRQKQSVVEAVSGQKQLSYDDATGIVNGQSFALQQAWGQGPDVQQAVSKIPRICVTPSHYRGPALRGADPVELARLRAF